MYSVRPGTSTSPIGNGFLHHVDHQNPGRDYGLVGVPYFDPKISYKANLKGRFDFGICYSFRSINCVLERTAFSMGMLLELSLQTFTPLVLLLFVRNRSTESITVFMKILVVLTFIGHGMYAMGIHPIPGHFRSMTMEILGSNENGTKTFLMAVGVMDILLAIGLWLPKWAKYFALYAAFWGLATTIARIWANLGYEGFESMSVRWSFEVLVRFPHFLIPLALFVLISERFKEEQQ